MVKIWIECGERYPVYDISEGPMGVFPPAEVSAAQLQGWKDALAAWQKAQGEMRNLFKIAAGSLAARSQFNG